MAEQQKDIKPAPEAGAKKKKKRRNRIWVMLLLLMSTVMLLFIILMVKFARFSQKKVNDLTQINYTVAQISQIVDNIRQVYMIYGNDTVLNNEFLLKSGAVPKLLIRGDRIVNPYGGDILIRPSVPVVNKKEDLSSPTFKMSYQGLTQDVCINLALLNWGDLSKGLQAVAIGFIDVGGHDVAMETIDNPPVPDEPEEYIDSQGQLRRRPVLPKYHMNVAKPKDKFIPTPFTYEKAVAGCKCVGRPNCTFALQYMIYGVDAPKKVDDPLTAAQRKLQK